MQLLIGFIVAICVFAWYAEDILGTGATAKTPVAATHQAASSNVAAKRNAKPQPLSDEELLELVKTDPQAAVRLYQLSLQSVQQYEDQDMNKYLADGKYDPETVNQSLKNAVAKINAASTATEEDPANAPAEQRILHEPKFREKVKNTDLQTAFQEYQASYHAVERTEFNKLQEFLATGKYE